LILPVPVNLNRLAADRLVLSFILDSSSGLPTKFQRSF
jgi:hypothetical protein